MEEGWKSRLMSMLPFVDDDRDGGSRRSKKLLTVLLLFSFSSQFIPIDPYLVPYLISVKHFSNFQVHFLCCIWDNVWNFRYLVLICFTNRLKAVTGMLYKFIAPVSLACTIVNFFKTIRPHQNGRKDARKPMIHFTHFILDQLYLLTWGRTHGESRRPHI